MRDKQHAVSKRLKTDQEVGVAQPVLHRSRSLQRVEGECAHIHCTYVHIQPCYYLMMQGWM